MKQMKFEGMPARSSEVKIKASRVLAELDHKLKIGDPVYYLMRGEVTGVHHDRDKKDEDSLVRTHVVTVKGARRVDHEGEVADAIVADAALYLQSLEDNAAGDGEEDGGDE